MTLSGLKLDLSDCFNLAEGRYTICQTILDSRAYYEMWDNLKNKEVVPYADGKVRLIDKDGKVIRPTIKILFGLNMIANTAKIKYQINPMRNGTL